jgi:hypothetical protein
MTSLHLRRHLFDTKGTNKTESLFEPSQKQNDGIESIHEKGTRLHGRNRHNEPEKSQENRASVTQDWSNTWLFTLFFFAGIGCTLGWASVLSNVSLYSDILGNKSFTQLNVAVFAPLLPVTVIQAICDSHLDYFYSTQTAFYWQGVIGFVTTIVTISLVSIITQRAMRESTLDKESSDLYLGLLTLVCSIMGIASAMLHGMLKQLASMTMIVTWDPIDGTTTANYSPRLSAAVSVGLRGSGAVVLFFTMISNTFGRGVSEYEISLFYFDVSVGVAMCWVSFHTIIFYCPDVAYSFKKRDSYLRHGKAHHNSDQTRYKDDDTNMMMEPYLVETNDSQKSSIRDKNLDTMVELGYRELWKVTWPLCVSIFVTVGSSVAIAACLDQVESVHATVTILPQILFFASLLGDFVGRWIALQCPSGSGSQLLGLSLVRLLFVPILFLYLSGVDVLDQPWPYWLPKSDAYIVLGMGAFALSSGYISSSCFQLAPQCLISSGDDVSNAAKQSRLIIICFSLSEMVGVLTSLFVGGGSRYTDAYSPPSSFFS